MAGIDNYMPYPHEEPVGAVMFPHLGVDPPSVQTNNPTESHSVQSAMPIGASQDVAKLSEHLLLTNGHSEDPAALSQPMSLTLSGSSLSSVKDEEVNGSAPYGTRSRNRSGARPNYSEDLDMDFESKPTKIETASSKRSSPSELSVGFRAVNGVEAQSASHNGREGESPHANTMTTTTTQDRTGGIAPEKKKRKYERANVNKAAPDARNPSKDMIPGTSQFFATANRTSDPPPSKKRKTVESHVSKPSAQVQVQVPLPSVTPATVLVPLRKSSTSHVIKYAPRRNCLVTFERTNCVLQDGKLEADDGTTYGVDDCVYLICEPPGEPYYLARIMEFRRADMDEPGAPVTSMLVNWFYRPKDIQRYSTDPRYLYASMQSDECPITSLRGKCFVRHRSTIIDLEDYRKQRDTFWFNQLYDRYIQRPYEMVPAAAVINVPANVKKAIDERWKFLVVEPARMKEFTSAVKLCKRCSGYCAPNDSVDCGVCRNTYHMTCVSPPLVKKPSRGFAWSCGPCSRAQEKRLEERHAALLPDAGAGRDDEIIDEEEEESGTVTAQPDADSLQGPRMSTDEGQSTIYVDLARANMWPWRYLGIHCRVEDVLQYDDRAIYPRATSRLGPRHQAVIAEWFGRPVQLVKPLEVKRKYVKGSGSKKEAKLSKETLAALELEKQERAKRPKWIQDAPPGYIARGEDYPPSDERCTAEPSFIVPQDLNEPDHGSSTLSPPEVRDKLIDDYMSRARALGKELGFAREVFAGFRTNKAHPKSDPQVILPTNYLDKALPLLNKHAFNSGKALAELRTVHAPQDIGDPVFTKEEMKKFEDGVARYGSELRLVRKHVKSRPYGEVVRMYYSWKKSEKGQEIWSQHGERRHSRKRVEVSWTDIADDEDDSAFDNDKSVVRKRRFQCKFCLTRSCRQWRRAPNVAPGAVVLDDPKGSAKDKANQLVVALCERCAFLWRRYAMRWEDLDEIVKSLSQSGGRAWKRKNDEEILRELVHANESAGIPTSAAAAAAALSIGIQVTVLQEPPKKKLKITHDKENTPAVSDPEVSAKKKEKEKVQPPPPPPRPPTPPIEPQPPKWKELPCAVCRELEISNNELLSCKHCKLSVHRRCYGIPGHTNSARWICDTCLNDKQNELSLDYKCVLCPVTDRKPELVEPPKATHKKKTERDREKERLEKKLADEMAALYQKQQGDKGRPVWPREAVKKTASNNWVHLVCAIWTPEIRFGEVETLQSAEGIAAALTVPSRVEAVCKLCKVIDGACILCHQCHDTFHVACAHEAGYVFGFDITPVKASRKDLISIVSLGGESGYMTAAVWCKEHSSSIKTIAHGIHELDPESNLNALQLFVGKFKQADRALTGTARKANMLTPVAKATAAPNSGHLPSRRTSLLVNGNSGLKDEPPSPMFNERDGSVRLPTEITKHQCTTCGTEASPRWQRLQPVNGHSHHDLGFQLGLLNGSRLAPLWQCHRCYTNGTLNIKPESRLSDKLETSTTAKHQPDYFELTAPRPMPPQLLGWTGADTESSRLYGSGDPKSLTRAQNDLYDSKVTVTNQAGLSHELRGTIFGRIEDAAVIAWSFFQFHVTEKLGFDAQKHAVLTEDGSIIHNTPTLLKALAKLISRGRNHAKWRIVDYVPEPAPALSRPQSRSSHLGPPPPPLAPRSSGSLQPLTAFPSPATRPAPAGIIAVLPPAHGMQPPRSGSPLHDVPAMSVSSRSSPYYSQSPAPRHAHPASFTGGSVSPPRASGNARRSTTPREQGVIANGASSSPNLRNLVH